VKQVYDADADALYVELADRTGRVARTVAIDNGTNVDLDADGNLLGIEVIRPQRLWPLPAILRMYLMSDEHAAVLMASYPCGCSAEVA
jgi:uncharacterized protein YuzE